MKSVLSEVIHNLKDCGGEDVIVFHRIEEWLSKSQIDDYITRSVVVNLRIAQYNSFCRRLWDTVRPYGYGKNTFFCSAEAYFSRAGAIN